MARRNIIILLTSKLNFQNKIQKQSVILIYILEYVKCRSHTYILNVKQKSEGCKITAVKYYLENDTKYLCREKKEQNMKVEKSIKEK